tara:strand:+ start:665 stop:1054 length:390 start_codon:yes stop_codon:yes gene_type:complete
MKNLIIIFPLLLGIYITAAFAEEVVPIAPLRICQSPEDVIEKALNNVEKVEIVYDIHGKDAEIFLRNYNEYPPPSNVLADRIIAFGIPSINGKSASPKLQIVLFIGSCFIQQGYIPRNMFKQFLFGVNT